MTRSNRNWALVVGCDGYRNPAWNLSGAVRDALAIREWLLDSQGGAVPANQMITLLTPSSSGARTPPSLHAQRASNEHIQAAMHDIVGRSNGEADRLYVFFAGHGLIGRLNSTVTEAIAPDDFTEELTDRSLAISSITDFFGATAMREQFFFFDSCRNSPFASDYELGRVARPRSLPGRRGAAPAPEQFVSFATQRGSRAMESPSSGGEERGAFSTALVKGLRGDRTAKVWDRANQSYVVTWNSVFAYVDRCLHELRLQVGDDLEREVVQAPRRSGDYGNNDPVLSEFKSESVPTEILSVALGPATVRETAQVTILLDDATRDLTYGPPSPSPQKVEVRPRSYTIRAEAPGWYPVERSWHVSVYEPTNVKLMLRRGMAPAMPSSAVLRGSFGPASPGAERCSASADALGVVEIFDGDGVLRAIGAGWAEVEGKGWFRVSIVSPEGAVAERWVEVGACERTHVDLADENRLAVQRRDPLAEHRGRALLVSVNGGLGAVPEGAHAQLFTTDLRPVPLATESLQDGSTMTAFDAGPGAHLLRLRGISHGDLVVPVSVFAERTAVVVVEAVVNQPPLVLQGSAPTQPAPDSLDLLLGLQAQRFAARGLRRHAELLLDRLVDSDPVTTGLRAYLRMGHGDPDGAARTIERASVEASNLPDAAILLRWIGSGGRSLEANGLPIFVCGLNLLLDLINPNGEQGEVMKMLTELRAPSQVISTFAGSSALALAARVRDWG